METSTIVVLVGGCCKRPLELMSFVQMVHFPLHRKGRYIIAFKKLHECTLVMPMINQGVCETADSLHSVARTNI